MKKYYPRAWLFASLSLVSTVSLAFTPIITSIIFTCPCVDTITQATNHLEGQGTEFISNINNPIIFTSSNNLANTPSEFSNYSTTSINYQSTLGTVVCNYTSSDATQSPVSLSYSIVNGIGGIVQAHSNNSVMIGLPLGIKAYSHT